MSSTCTPVVSGAPIAASISPSRARAAGRSVMSTFGSIATTAASSGSKA
jgi:hypothetical protein